MTCSQQKLAELAVAAYCIGFLALGPQDLQIVRLLSEDFERLTPREPIDAALSHVRNRSVGRVAIFPRILLLKAARDIGISSSEGQRKL